MNFILDIILSVYVTTVPINYLYLYLSNCGICMEAFFIYVMRVINEYSL